MIINKKPINYWECDQKKSPQSRPTKSGEKRVLTKDYTHHFKLLNGQKAKITVPSEYEFEVSIPRPFQPAKTLLYNYYALEASVVVHDWIYKNKGSVTYKVKNPIVNPSIGLVDQTSWKVMKNGSLSRKQADIVLVSNPEDAPSIRWIAYNLSRTFGGFVWNGTIDNV